MKKIMKFVAILLIILMQLFFIAPQKAYALGTTVDLGTIEDFAIFAGSAVTDSSPDAGIDIIGDVGLHPTGGASITGLTCAQITGTIYDNNAGYAGGGGCLVTDLGGSSTLQPAKDDLGTAYTDAAGQGSDFAVLASTTDSFSGTGYTLTPGVYTSASTMGITGTLTLDGGGDPDAVFIFQAGSSLTTATSSQVVLTDSAQACNVFWQVGSDATLGTTSTFVGTVMAQASITDDGNSVIDGRLLADANDDGTGAVTLSDTTVEVSTCIAPTPTPTTAASSTLSLTEAGASSTSCPPLPSTLVAPTIVASNRVDADSIFISWGPYSGTNTFNVSYGPTNGNWLYSTDVTGFSTTINALPSNQPMWFRVAPRSDCAIGSYGPAMLVGGTGSLSNSLIPGLPNTGVAPEDKNTPLIIIVGVLLGVVLFYTTWRVHKSSSK